jgi:hypothetical protein
MEWGELPWKEVKALIAVNVNDKKDETSEARPIQGKPSPVRENIINLRRIKR